MGNVCDVKGRGVNEYMVKLVTQTEYVGETCDVKEWCHMEYRCEPCVGIGKGVARASRRVPTRGVEGAFLPPMDIKKLVYGKN